MNIRRKLYAAPILFFAAVMISGVSLRGEERTPAGNLGFGEIWELVKSNSPARKGAAAESEAAGIMERRQGRHWLPRVYAEGRGYVTNDAGITFMSNMGQRSVTTDDFVPGTLNRPGSSYYNRVTLGADLTLYEGGAGTENARASGKIAEAKRYERISVNLSEYSRAASAYGGLVVRLRAGAEMKELHSRVSAVLANYQGGLASNPVEYSGILGLRALKNRVEAMMAENAAAADSARSYLGRMSGVTLPAEWVPLDGDAVEFADIWLNVRPGASAGDSYMVKAYNSYAESAKFRAGAAGAVLLPKVGVFSEANIYNGDRDTADSYTAGFYIRMNILSPTEYGAVRQAGLESDAVRSKARDARLRAEIELERLGRFSDTLKSNIKKLRESSAIMDEQIRNSQRLYAGGSLRSFQLAEVFSRKADMIASLAAAEGEYLAVRSGLYNYSGEEVEHER